MKVWITKYALTDGIIEADAEPCGLDVIYHCSIWNCVEKQTDAICAGKAG